MENDIQPRNPIIKVEELKGQDIIKAYDGEYLSDDFGYSCANFNVYDFKKGYGKKSDQDNDMQMFDIFIQNPKNISCFVAYNEDGEIIGRRMFFKGKSLLDDKLYDIPDKLGHMAYYLYGYYGEHNKDSFNAITRKAIMKYGQNVIHTDRSVVINGRSTEEPNYFILQIEKADFSVYPPIDHLYLCPEIRAFANFEPEGQVLKTLGDQMKKDGLKFGQAYRYKKNRVDHLDYKTWLQNLGYNIDDFD